MRPTHTALLFLVIVPIVTTSGGCRPGERAAGGSWQRPAEAPGAVTASVQPLRRLTRLEYDNTLRDLLGDRSAPAAAFPSEATGGGGFASPGAVSEVEARRFLEAAEAVAAREAADPARLTGCDPAQTKGGGRACAERFIRAFGRRAYRRPLATEEVAEHLAVYDASHHKGHAVAIRLLLTAMLESPLFLYHFHHGDDGVVKTAAGPALRLSSHAVAARLSYALWASMPDDELAAAADRRALDTADRIERQARRMLASPKARDMITDFVGQLVRLDRLRGMVKDKKAFGQWSPEVARAMAAETETFAAEALLGPDGDGKLATLLSAPFSFVSGPLARVYGLNGDDDARVRRVSLDPQLRAGLLTQASFLSINANAYEPSPILRGKFVREQLLCHTVAPPPPGTPPLEPKGKEPATLRERLEDHLLSGTCGRCHRAIDPIGYGLDAFDAIGRHRTLEEGKPLDLSGEVKGIDGADRPFTGSRELAALLSRSPEVARCFARQLFRYVRGQREADEDEPSVAAAHDVFARSGGDVRELLVAVVRSPAFRFRKPEAGEALP